MLENIKGKVIDELNERIGQTHYLCDLGMTLSESENADGSWYYSSYKAKEDIVDNFDFCGAFYQWHKDNFGEAISYNPFEDTELFHCTMMIFAVENAFSYALNKTEYSELWNDEFEITKEFVNAIEEAIEDIKEDDIF